MSTITINGSVGAGAGAEVDVDVEVVVEVGVVVEVEVEVEVEVVVSPFPWPGGTPRALRPAAWGIAELPAARTITAESASLPASPNES
jgi:hypothetical protein